MTKLGFWEVTVRFRFEAAHRLPLHEGVCRRLHGHSWQGHVTLTGHDLHDKGAETGMLIDFQRVKEGVDTIVNTYLDHHYLNETLPGDIGQTPSAEMIAWWLFEEFRKLSYARGWPSVTEVAIEETCTTRAVYRG